MHRWKIGIVSEQLVDGNAQDTAQLRQTGDVRHGVAALPAADRLKADGHLLGKLHLGHVFLAAMLGDDLTGFLCIKHNISSLAFVVVGSAFIINQARNQRQQPLLEFYSSGDGTQSRMTSSPPVSFSSM